MSGVRGPGSRGEKAWVPSEADAWGGCRSPLRFHAHRASRFGVGAWVLGLEVLPLVAPLSGSGPLSHHWRSAHPFKLSCYRFA
jgi:hypothetical protein